MIFMGNWILGKMRHFYEEMQKKEEKRHKKDNL
jgi:hypothetical protein